MMFIDTLFSVLDISFVCQRSFESQTSLWNNSFKLKSYKICQHKYQLVKCATYKRITGALSASAEVCTVNHVNNGKEGVIQ